MRADVKEMIDNPGIYVLSDIAAPRSAVVVSSINGHLVVLRKDKELDPEGFTDGMTILHGPLRAGF